jgi:hypothetical protein
LRKVIRDTLDMIPGRSASVSENAIQTANSETMRLLAEILEVADDAQLEGRTSTINHDAVVQAAGNLRRIANRLAPIAIDRLSITLPRMDPETEAAREGVLDGIARALESWLTLFERAEALNINATHALARSHSRTDIARPLETFATRLAANQYAALEAWSADQRRTILSELQSMRRLEFLVFELNRMLGQIPGPATKFRGAIAQPQPLGQTA